MVLPKYLLFHVTLSDLSAFNTFGKRDEISSLGTKQQPPPRLSLYRQTGASQRLALGILGDWSHMIDPVVVCSFLMLESSRCCGQDSLGPNRAIRHTKLSAKEVL